VLWLDSTQTSSLRLANNRVQQWLDRSGKGNHTVQPEFALQPVRILGQGVEV
jgi:hypothetical protein